MEYLVIWGFFGILAATIAGGKGRSGFSWFILGLLLGPFALAVACLPSLKPQFVAAAPAPAAGLVPCPECAELIQRQARKCRFCGSAVTPPPEPKDLACYHCNWLNKRSAIYCSDCGKKVHSPLYDFFN
jgi:RNA polymerase subunit RPABC4/transcription elongation factor Spt4